MENEAKTTHETQKEKNYETPIEVILQNSTNSQLFKVVCICTIIVGFISGIVSAFAFKLTDITYKYPTIQEGMETVEKLNIPLMFIVWVSTAVVALLFWAISCHLYNQETIIAKLDK